jgi:hypothetical protein
MVPAVMQALVAALWIHAFKVRMRKMARHASWSGLQVESQLSAAHYDVVSLANIPQSCSALFAGECTAGVLTNCSALTDQCNIGLCDPQSGDCVQRPRPDLTACFANGCQLGSFCTSEDIFGYSCLRMMLAYHTAAMDHCSSLAG